MSLGQIFGKIIHIISSKRVKSRKGEKKVWAKKKGWPYKIKSFVKKLLRIKDSPEKIALGLAIGVFWGIMPTFGFAILFSLPTALLFRGNKLAAILGTFIANPLTIPLFYPFGYKIGQLILKTAPLPFSWDIFNLESLLNISKSLLVGNFLLAIGLALLIYFLVLQIIIRYRARYHPK